MLEKLGQSAFEANFIFDGFHTRFNPGNFRQSQIVDVVCLQWQGRRLLDHILIQAFAALHGGQAHLFARQWQIAVAQEVTQTGIGWVQTVYDDIAIFRCQARFVRIAEIRREFQNWPVIRRPFGLLRQLCVQLINDIADRHLRFEYTRRHALAETANRCVHEDDEFLVTLQVIFVILNRLERRCTLSTGEGRIKSVKTEKVVEWTHDRQVHNFFGQAL